MSEALFGHPVYSQLMGKRLTLAFLYCDFQCSPKLSFLTKGSPNFAEANWYLCLSWGSVIHRYLNINVWVECHFLDQHSKWQYHTKPHHMIMIHELWQGKVNYRTKDDNWKYVIFFCLLTYISHIILCHFDFKNATVVSSWEWPTSSTNMLTYYAVTTPCRTQPRYSYLLSPQNAKMFSLYILSLRESGLHSVMNFK